MFESNAVFDCDTSIKFLRGREGQHISIFVCSHQRGTEEVELKLRTVKSFPPDFSENRYQLLAFRGTMLPVAYRLWGKKKGGLGGINNEVHSNKTIWDLRLLGAGSWGAYRPSSGCFLWLSLLHTLVNPGARLLDI